MQRFTKKSTETFDYDIPLDEYFAERADTIASHVVEADPGITVVSSSQTLDPKLIRVWLSGGTDGAEYGVTVRMTTTSAPAVVDDFDFTIRVKD